MAEQLAELNKEVSIKVGSSETVAYTGTPSSTTTASQIQFVAPYSGFYCVRSIAGSPDGWLSGPDSAMQAQSGYYVYICGMANKGDTVKVNTYRLVPSTQFVVAMRKVYAD